MQEFNLPFIKEQTIQRLAFLDFDPSQQAVCPFQANDVAE